ncbi:class I SAM-dependent methyltransferase [Roseisalinus antarcticus]|uniref:Methyltransferase type 11 domain-containing protein n=1 Tax=Roseisalinus antarcticus TaxID=254357 RepID=A0A1Y5RLW7_9RHOB|nr:class I SAM-dependent methyltransferase [Roseisalinus antarcticus]SLN17714.1 hypothetical protein ROA7023_00343 [Roseisalinus antarcticus]
MSDAVSGRAETGDVPADGVTGRGAVLRKGTKTLWDKQNRHPGDRSRLFGAVGRVISPAAVLYPGSYVDIAPSMVFPDVTYSDMDRRAARFFDDTDGVREILAEEGAPPDRRLSFIHADYAELSLPEQSFDLLVSLYAGFVSEHCTAFLKVGGHLLVNPSHGDAALAAIDPRYALAGVVVSRSGDYQVSRSDLGAYLQPSKALEITREMLFATGRGVAYTRPAFAYIFERVS